MLVSNNKGLMDLVSEINDILEIKEITHIKCECEKIGVYKAFILKKVHIEE